MRTVPGARTYTYDSGFARAGYGYGGFDQEVVSYREGMLALEFFDVGTRRAVWIGEGTKRLSREKVTEEMIGAVIGPIGVLETILASFPARR